MTTWLPELGNWVTGGAAVLVAGVFGRPTWVLARHRLAEQARAAEESKQRADLYELAQAVARVLAGTDDPAEMPHPNRDNPSIRDQLNEALEQTAAVTSAVALLHHMLELHMAEPHGGHVPEWMVRAASTDPGRWMRGDNQGWPPR